MSSRKNIQILLFPGLGGDRRMAIPQRALPFKVIGCDLIEMLPKESIEAYARRWKENILARGIIDPSRPLVLGGYSFGSAVACIMSHELECDALLIIGGITSCIELRPLVRFVGRYFIKHFPDAAFDVVTPVVRYFLRHYTKLTKSDTKLCTDMYRNFSRSLFRDAYHELANWRGCEIKKPVLRIHGAEDQIVRPPAPSRRVTLVPKSKHLVNFSGRQTVNRSIEEFVDRTVQRASEGVGAFRGAASIKASAHFPHAAER